MFGGKCAECGGLTWRTEAALRNDEASTAVDEQEEMSGRLLNCSDPGPASRGLYVRRDLDDSNVRELVGLRAKNDPRFVGVNAALGIKKEVREGASERKGEKDAERQMVEDGALAVPKYENAKEDQREPGSAENEAAPPRIRFVPRQVLGTPVRGLAERPKILTGEVYIDSHQRSAA